MFYLLVYYNHVILSKQGSVEDIRETVCRNAHDRQADIRAGIKKGTDAVMRISALLCIGGYYPIIGL